MYLQQIFNSEFAQLHSQAQRKFTCSRVFGQWVIQCTRYCLEKIHFLSLPCENLKKKSDISHIIKYTKIETLS